MTFESPDDVLEHFGVKGQKWGVRRSRSSGNKGSSNKKKVAVAVLVVGAAAATAVLASRSGVKVSSLSSPIATSAPRLGSAVANPLRTSAPRVGSSVANPTSLGASAARGVIRMAGRQTLNVVAPR